MALPAYGNIYGAGTSGWWHNPAINKTGGPQGSWNNPYQPTLADFGYGTSGSSGRNWQVTPASQMGSGGGGGSSGYGSMMPWDQANAANQARADEIRKGYNDMRTEVDSQSDQLSKDAIERNNIELSRIKQDMAGRGLTGSTVGWAPNAMQNRELDRNLNYIGDQRIQNRLGVMQGFANFLERQNDVGPSYVEAMAMGQGFGQGSQGQPYFGAPVMGGGYGGGGYGGYAAPTYRMPVMGLGSMYASTPRSSAVLRAPTGRTPGYTGSPTKSTPFDPEAYARILASRKYETTAYPYSSTSRAF